MALQVPIKLYGARNAGIEDRASGTVASSVSVTDRVHPDTNA